MITTWRTDSKGSGTYADQLYHAVAPRPEDFGRLLDKIGDYMKVPYDAFQSPLFAAVTLDFLDAEAPAGADGQT